jgi:hypothetical protein
VACVLFSFASAEATQFGAKSKLKVHDVLLSDSVTLDSSDHPLELKRITQGLRRKSIAIVWVSVYVAQVFSADPKTADLKSIDALRESLLKNLPLVVSMTFVRDVDVGKLVDGYKEVFEKNSVPMEKAPYDGILKSVRLAGDVTEGQTYFFTFTKGTFTFETKGSKPYTVKDLDESTQRNLLKMWFAEPADSGSKKMQVKLLAIVPNGTSK